MGLTFAESLRGTLLIAFGRIGWTIYDVVAMDAVGGISCDSS